VPKGIVNPCLTVAERRRIVEEAAARLVASLTRLDAAMRDGEGRLIVAERVAQCQLEASAVEDRLALLMILLLNEPL